MGHVESKARKSRSLGHFLKKTKTFVHSRRHNSDSVFIQVCRNIYLNEIKARIKKNLGL